MRLQITNTHTNEITFAENINDTEAMFRHLADAHGVSGLHMSDNFTTDSGWWDVEVTDEYGTYIHTYTCEMVKSIEVANYEKYLNDITEIPPSHQVHILHFNNCIKKAWKRTDKRLTRINAGIYLAKIGDEIHIIQRSGNGGWVTGELGLSTDDRPAKNLLHSRLDWFEGTLSNFRKETFRL